MACGACGFVQDRLPAVANATLSKVAAAARHWGWHPRLPCQRRWKSLDAIKIFGRPFRWEQTKISTGFVRGDGEILQKQWGEETPAMNSSKGTAN